jgi:hypothetical protein
MRVDVMGTTILPWCAIVEQKIAELSRFEQFLRPEDRAVFDDLLTQCKLYAAGGWAYLVFAETARPSGRSDSLVNVVSTIHLVSRITRSLTL